MFSVHSIAALQLVSANPCLTYEGKLTYTLSLCRGFAKQDWFFATRHKITSRIRVHIWVGLAKKLPSPDEVACFTNNMCTSPSNGHWADPPRSGAILIHSWSFAPSLAGSGITRPLVLPFTPWGMHILHGPWDFGSKPDNQDNCTWRIASARSAQTTCKSTSTAVHGDLARRRRAHKSSRCFTSKTSLPRLWCRSNGAALFWRQRCWCAWQQKRIVAPSKCPSFMEQSRASAHMMMLPIRDFQKALETTTAMKRHNLTQNLQQLCSFKLVTSRSLHDAAKVVISRLLTRDCCSLAVVVSVIICASMMARWRSRRFTVVATLVVVSRSLPLWDLGGSNWDTRKS